MIWLISIPAAIIFGLLLGAFIGWTIDVGNRDGEEW